MLLISFTLTYAYRLLELRLHIAGKLWQNNAPGNPGVMAYGAQHTWMARQAPEVVHAIDMSPTGVGQRCASRTLFQCHQWDIDVAR